MFVTLQLWCESSGVGVWQQQLSPAQWSPSFCCFWTDVRPQSSPVWAEPVWEYWTEWSANLDLEYLLDGAGQETKGDGKIKTVQSFFSHCCCQMHCSRSEEHDFSFKQFIFTFVLMFLWPLYRFCRWEKRERESSSWVLMKLSLLLGREPSFLSTCRKK